MGLCLCLCGVCWFVRGLLVSVSGAHCTADVDVLFCVAVSLLLFLAARLLHRSHLELTSPSVYARNVLVWLFGDGFSVCLRSGRFSVGRCGVRRRLATLSARQRSQTWNPSPNRYTEWPMG